MKRRKLLKHFLLAGALTPLPEWAFGWSKLELATNQVKFLSLPESDTLKICIDTILPSAVNGPGGLSLGLDQFLEKLLLTCYETEVQENFRKQLISLEHRGMEKFGKPFSQCEKETQLELLMSCQKSEVEEEKKFFDLLKSECIRGFRTSREVMIKYYKYRVAPGHFYGCVPTKNL